MALGRIAVLGAFPYPYPQGSQIFAADQARALRTLGARPVLLTYGRGVGEPARDLDVAPRAAWSSPRPMRAGASWRKPAADAALYSAYLREARREPFDVALAHNAEAALVALAARRRIGVPVVYVAHSVLRHELGAYLPVRAERTAARLGSALDRVVASRADRVIALSEAARSTLDRFSRYPIEVIPPGLDPPPPPSSAERARTCLQLGLSPGRFVLYSGAIDGYQDLALLVEAARLRPAGAPPIAIATHDARGAARRLPADAGIQCVQVEGFRVMRALCHSAQALVISRTRPGGFPIKLLNYMEAARPIVAFANVAEGLEHERSALLLEPGADAGALARALQRLDADPVLADRLGTAALRQLHRRHAWAQLAPQIRAVLEPLTASAPALRERHRGRSATLS